MEGLHGDHARSSERPDASYVGLREQATDRTAREQAFWDGHVRSLESCLNELSRGPDRNTKRMFDEVEPLSGQKVLDFACGSGVTSAFLANRGADVTAIDISDASIARARELARVACAKITFITGELTADTFPPASFDAVIGRFALHHTDRAVIAPIIGQLLAPGGRGAFVETMGINPALRFARNHLVGRGPIQRLGTDDERPLEQRDLAILGQSVGPVTLAVDEMQLLRIMDRNIFGHRHPVVTRAAGWCDDRLKQLGLGRWSYQQIVVVRRV